MPRTCAIAAIILGGSLVAATSGAAQTMLDPYPTRGVSPAPEKARTHEERRHACSAYGPGFVQIPGTGACVKIGGYTTIQATGR